VHVPLVRTGPDATVNLAAAPFFGAMRAGAVFLNTSRGAVVDEAALAAALDAGRVSHAVLDVWQNEPAIDPALVRWAFIATAHIAGYSFDGKVAATQMICGALAAWLTDGATAVDLSPLLPAPPVPIVDVTEHTGGDEDVLRTIVSRVYDIGEDDRALREAMASDAPAARFDLLRKTYWQRREFRHTTVVASAARASLIRRAAQLGFQVRTH
jgi:erythronate-4-phosphate dehydrogenase